MHLKDGFSSWKNLLVLVSSVVLIIAAFFTWVIGSFSSELAALVPNLENEIITGIGLKFGYISAACGLAAFVLLFLRKSKIITIILGAVAFLTAGLIWLYTAKVVPSMTADIVSKNGAGVYLTMIAAAGLIVGGFLMKKTVKKK
jgi:hypothetical protein